MDLRHCDFFKIDRKIHLPNLQNTDAIRCIAYIKVKVMSKTPVEELKMKIIFLSFSRN